MSEAARRDHFPQVRVVRFCGEGGAGAEEGREEAAVGLFDCPVQRRVSVVIPRVDRGAVSEEQFCRLDVRIVSQTRLVKRRVIVVVAPVHVGTGLIRAATTLAWPQPAARWSGVLWYWSGA